MRNVVHLIGPWTPLDLLEQVRLLSLSRERVYSVGPPPEGAALWEGVKVLHCPLGCPGLAAMRLPEAVRGAEVLHAWGRSEAADLCGYRGRRLVLSLGCLPPARAMEALIVRMRAGELALTVPTAGCQEAFAEMGAPSTCLHVLPPAAPPVERAGAGRDRLRRELGVEDGQALLVAPGELVRDAGHKYAPWVHAVLRQIRPDLRLLIPGRGPVEGRVRFYVESTGLASEVFLTEGRYSTGEALAAADVAVFFHERDCDAAAVARAMAAGLPIVASRTPLLAEVLGGEEAAVLVAPGRPREQSAGLLRVLDDAGLVARMSLAAKRRAAERHDPARCRSLLEGVYASLE
jgi:glycosyltransferase involved in cell wall biosynthesis